MQKRKSTKSAARDALVSLFCLLLSFLFIALYIMDLNASVSRDDGDIIATISFKRKVAQRRFIDRMVWDRLEQNAPLYNGDTIRTDTGSEAVITFGNNTVIELDESSIAQIFLSNQAGTEINFSGGSIVASSGGEGGITVRSGDTEVALGSGGSAALSAGAQDDPSAVSAVSLRMLSGEALVTSGGTSEAVREGDAVSVQGSEVSQRAFSLLTPAPNMYVLDTGGQGSYVDFSWKLNDAPAGSYVLIETAVTKRFGSILSSAKITGGTSARVNFPLGTTFYRATLMSSSDEALEDASSGSINVIYSAPPTLTVPALHDVFHYRRRLPILRFGWLGNEYAASYRLEIADNEAMSSPAVEIRTTESTAVVSTLGEGTWFWRVTEEFPDTIHGEDAMSEVSSFIIEQRGNLENVTLKMPLAGYVINSGAQSTPVLFSWEESSEAVSYDFYLTDRAQGENVIAKISRVEPFVSVNLEELGIAPGVYYWYVTQTDFEGAESAASEVRAFSVLEGESELRPVFPPDGFSIFFPLLYDTAFTWKTNLPGDVLLEIATDRNFTNIVYSEQSHGSMGELSGINLPAPQGNADTYFWRMTALAAEQVSESPRSFNVTPPLASPRITNIREGARIVIRSGESGIFIWNAVPGASYYSATITDYDGDEVFRLDETEDTSFAFDFAEQPSGRYTVSLRAEGELSDRTTRRTGYTSTSHFQIRKLRPISLVSPREGEAFDGVEAVLHPGQLRWEIFEPDHGTEVVIARTRSAIPDAAGAPSDEMRSIVFRGAVTGNNITIPDIREGTFYWRVLSTTEDNIDMSARRASSFTILPIPPLPRVSYVSPLNGTDFDINYLRSSMSARLEWQGTEDATNYVLRIDRLNADGTRENVVTHETGLNETSYVIQDLSTLDEGDFEWSVEALQRLSDGSILRHGERAVSSFKISLPVIPEFNLDESGERYGN